jgi:Cytochrome C'
MKRRAGMMFAAFMLALTLWSLTAHSAADDDDEDVKAAREAQKDLLQLAEAIDAHKGDVGEQAKAIRKKYDELKPIMYIYKPRKKGGLGMGREGSGIENEMNRLGGTKSSPKKIEAVKDDLIKAAKISRAVAELTDLYPPKKDVEKWKGYTKDMRKGSDELIEAAKGGDGVKMKKALINLNSSCTNCHSDFRND